MVDWLAVVPAGDVYAGLCQGISRLPDWPVGCLHNVKCINCMVMYHKIQHATHTHTHTHARAQKPRYTYIYTKNRNGVQSNTYSMCHMLVPVRNAPFIASALC